MTLRPCSRCRRHVVAADPTCPFCGAAVEPAPPARSVLGRLSRAAVFASAAGCYTSTTPRQEQQAPPPPPPTETTSERGDFAQPPPGDSPPPPPPATGTGTVRGTILYGDQPAVGAVVFLESFAGAPRRETRTNDRGEYVFDAVPVGRYRVGPMVVRHPRGNAPPDEIFELVANGQQVSDFDIPVVQHHHSPKPYGAPPARRRVV